MAHPKAPRSRSGEPEAIDGQTPRHFVLEVGDDEVGVLTAQRGRFVFHTARADLDSLQGERFRSLTSARQAVRQKLAKGRGAGARHRSLRRTNG
jgi:hypothetical protein